MADGGADAVENIDVLCERCHNEWHYLLEGVVPYDRFFETIPAHILQAMLLSDEGRQLSLEHIHGAWVEYSVGRVGFYVSDALREAFSTGAAK
jgi:hypothetical protein